MIRVRVRSTAAALAAVTLAAAGAATIDAAGADTAPVVAPDARAVAASRILAAAPTASRSSLAPGYDGTGAERAAAVHGEGIPLPPGGSFAGIRWAQAEGVIGDAEVQSTLQYNATCQWLRAWRDGRDPATAREVLADAPRWSALRVADVDGALGRAAAGVAAGDPEAPALRGLLADCDASAVRERRYAIERGLEPPR